MSSAGEVAPKSAVESSKREGESNMIRNWLAAVLMVGSL
jgi:hypothetical protein